MAARSTRLRYVTSRDLDLLLRWVELLPFKIEIKGQPTKNGNRWIMFFVPTEEENPAYDKYIKQLSWNLS